MGFGTDLPEAEGGGEEGEASPEVVGKGGEAKGGIVKG